MANVINRSGIQPEVRDELRNLGAALSGNIIWVVTPSTVSTVATSSAWTRTVMVSLEDGSGNVHTWFTKTFSGGISIADTSTAGTASIVSTTLAIVNGRASITISGTAASWLANQTDTLTVAQQTINGVTVASVTSVETFTA